MDQELNAHEKQALLAIARQAIICGVQTGQEYIEPREEKTLNQRKGCFVTIKQSGQLRGCIGNFQSELPLFKEVAQIAQASAAKDPRFYPLKEKDLDNFTLEISSAGGLIHLFAVPVSCVTAAGPTADRALQRAGQSDARGQRGRD